MRVHAQASPKAKEKWEAIIASYLASGLSIKKFAKREGYSATSVWAWKRRLAGLSKGPPVEQPPIVACAAQDIVGDSFLPLLAESRLPPSFPKGETQEQRTVSGQIQVRYPSGIELTITASVGDNTIVLDSIRTLAEVLR
jgi:transposase-like protein